MMETGSRIPKATSMLRRCVRGMLLADCALKICVKVWLQATSILPSASGHRIDALRLTTTMLTLRVIDVVCSPSQSCVSLCPSDCYSGRMTSLEYEGPSTCGPTLPMWRSWMSRRSSSTTGATDVSVKFVRYIGQEHAESMSSSDPQVMDFAKDIFAEG